MKIVNRPQVPDVYSPAGVVNADGISRTGYSADTIRAFANQRGSRDGSVIIDGDTNRIDYTTGRIVYPLDTEEGVSSVTLSSIRGGSDGSTVVLSLAHPAHEVVLQDDTAFSNDDTFILPSGNMTMRQSDVVVFRYVADMVSDEYGNKRGRWIEAGRLWTSETYDSADTDPESDHGALSGLLDDDHTQYLLADGTRPLTGSWNVGGGNIQITNAFQFATTSIGNVSTPTLLNTGDITIDAQNNSADTVISLTNSFGGQVAHVELDGVDGNFSELRFGSGASVPKLYSTGPASVQVRFNQPGTGSVTCANDGTGQADLNVNGAISLQDRLTAFPASTVPTGSSGSVQVYGVQRSGYVELRAADQSPKDNILSPACSVGDTRPSNPRPGELHLLLS